MEQTPVPNFDGYYVTPAGDVLSCKNKNRPFHRLKQQKVTQSKKKYLQVRLFNKEHLNGKLFYVHRLIWEVYNGEIPDDKTIDHIDGDPSNNCLSNLQLLSWRKNIKKYHQGRHSITFRVHKEEMIKDYQELGSYAKVARKWGCSDSCAWYVCNGLVLQTRNGVSTYVKYTRD